MVPPLPWKTDLIASCRILPEISLLEFLGLQEAGDTVILAGIFLHAALLALLATFCLWWTKIPHDVVIIACGVRLAQSSLHLTAEMMHFYVRALIKVLYLLTSMFYFLRVPYLVLMHFS